MAILFEKECKHIKLCKNKKYYDIYKIPSRKNWELNKKFISPIYDKYTVTYCNNHTYEDFLKLVNMKE